MTEERFPADELRQLGFDPAPLPSPQTPRPAPPDTVGLCGQQAAAALEEQKAALLTAEATAVIIRGAAEIVYGQGYRMPVYHALRAALATLGITKLPDGVRDADR